MGKEYSPFFIKICSVISHFFNPIISLTIFFIYFSFNNGLSAKQNLYHFGLLLVFIILPVVFWIGWNVKTKRYTNVDVSDRKQRKTLYFFIESVQLIYLIANYALFHIIDWIVLFILVLTIVMQWSNYFVKSSMHTAFNIFVAFLFFSYQPILGIIWGMITAIVAYTRIILKRHTLKEIIWGIIIASIISFMYLYAHNKTELNIEL